MQTRDEKLQETLKKIRSSMMNDAGDLRSLVIKQFYIELFRSLIKVSTCY